MNGFSDNKKRRVHPREKANFLARTTFLDNIDIIKNTYKKGTFDEDELFHVTKKCRAGNAGNELEIYLREDIKKFNHLSLYRTLWKSYGMKYLFLGLIQLIVRSIVIISIPATLAQIILYFQPGQDELSKIDAAWYAALLILLNFLSVTYLHNYLLVLSEMGIKVRTALCSVIFRKALRLTPPSLFKLSTGNIITMLTNDVTAIEKFIFYCNDVWVGVAQAVIVFYLIFKKMGMATAVGMGFFILVVPVQVLLGRISSRLRLKSSKKTDERLQATKEMLSNINLIKMHTWEDIFQDKINKFRKKEMSAILKIFLTKTSMLLIGSLTSKIAYYLLLTIYVLMGNTISAELIYYVTTLFLRIRHALNVAIPVGVTVIADMSASLKRIEQYLTAEEVACIETFETKNSRVTLKDVTIEIDGKEVLKEVNLKVDYGLTVISGCVGSGKTTILKTILDEYRFKSGYLDKDGCVSYASQEPWIFPSTLKQNIIFNQGFDSERYNQVLDICALKFDVQNFFQDSDCKIGDKGTNLSKGQKSRINLARAVYRRADIYLIDDCLSSLDIDVQNHIFQKCIREFLADKICIFVTQNLQFVEKGDKIVIMEHGRVILSNELSNKQDKNALDVYIEQENRCNITGMKDTSLQLNYKPSEIHSLLSNQKSKSSMYQENKKSGKVDLQSYEKYGRSGGGITVIVSILTLFLVTQFSKSYTEKFLSTWVNAVHQTSRENVTTNEGATEPDPSLKLYSFCTLATTLLSIFSALALFNFGRTASLNLHKKLVEAVTCAKVKFFDSTLIGNILNRFSKDLNIVDEQIPYAIYDFLEIFLGLCGVIVLITMVNIIFLIPTVIIFVILYLLQKLYMPTGRNLQRLDTATRSPVIGYLNSSLDGLTTIRAFEAEQILSKEFDNHQDLYSSANYTSKCCERAFGYYLDISCTFFIGIIIAIFIILDKETSVGDVGLAITQAFMLNSIVQYGIRKWAEIENKMTSVERLLEYTAIEKEEGNGPCDEFPEDKFIKYENVYFTYKNDQKFVLKNINLTINEGEKVGIVGRTGTGKSSLISLLFRLRDYNGKISIGGVDIKKISLKTLRSNMSIIAQDPILFTGLLRTNLDPTNSYSDADIWDVINKLNLGNIIKSLSIQITESGSNFSAGQRQLLCLARCVLSKNKLIILDEATSDVDQETEHLMNDILEKHTDNCTVLVVAHRLRTILSCDRIFVIQNGEIVENGNVDALSKDETSIFYNMLKKFE